MNKGLCNFYEPSPVRGAEYSFMKEEIEEEERLKREKIELDKVLDNADNLTPKEFKDKLKEILTPKEDDED
jgi:hypothetical protein